MKSFLLVAFLVFAFCSVEAQRAGTLDSSFGVNGLSIPTLKGNYNDIVNTVIMPDNKIVADIGGYKIIRFLPDGAVDTSFGKQGTTLLTNIYSARNITAQKDEKIIVVGSNQISGRAFLSITRLLPDGKVDSAFGNNGLVCDSSEANRTEVATDVVVQPNGKIAVCGSHYRQEVEVTCALMARYNTDGTPDISFGTNGKAIYTSTFFLPTAIALQADGKIVTGGDEQLTFALQRYNTNGSLDETFGDGGQVTTYFDRYFNFISDITIQSDGKILAAGEGRASNSEQPYMAIARYNKDGTLDNSFGEQGKAKIHCGVASSAFGITQQRNNKIVVAGRSATVNNYTFAITRLVNNGLIDSTFGTNGIVITEIGNSTFNEIRAVGLQSNGNIIAGGVSVNTNNIYRPALARYYGDPINQQSPIVKKIKRWIRNHTLNWQYNNDDVDYFVIERSSNGVKDFKEIGRIANMNRQSSNVNNMYSYSLSNASANGQHLTVNSQNYYRITAVSNNGSNITSDAIADESVSSIAISPNPVKDIIKISGLPANQKSTINIVNRNGNLLQSAICRSSICNINAAQLKSGLYNVQVTTGGATQTVRFIKE